MADRELTGSTGSITVNIPRMDLAKFQILINGCKFGEEIVKPVAGSGTSYEGLANHFKQFINSRVLPKFVGDDGRSLFWFNLILISYQDYHQILVRDKKNYHQIGQIKSLSLPLNMKLTF